MRKITRESIDHFLCYSEFNKANMKVGIFRELTSGQDFYPKIAKLYLFGKLIAMNYDTRKGRFFEISNAGYKTATTKDRLNSIPGVSIVQKDFVWYLNGKEWDGNWIRINA